MGPTKSNTPYANPLLIQHILALSEHWLQVCELQSLYTLHPDFNFLTSTPPADEYTVKVSNNFFLAFILMR